MENSGCSSQSPACPVGSPMFRRMLALLAVVAIGGGIYYLYVSNDTSTTTATRPTAQAQHPAPTGQTTPAATATTPPKNP